MSLLTTIRKGVAIANKVTKPLQSTVTYERFMGDDGMGNDNYSGKKTLHAIVDWKQKHLRTASGELTVSRVMISLLDINEVNAATGGKGIGDKDKFTLGDGTTGPIIDLSGFIDAGTNHPIATEVWLG